MQNGSGMSRRKHFYSRPCGRGDVKPVRMGRKPAINFYSRPCGRGDCCRPLTGAAVFYFYSRPCGRGDSRYFEADAEEVTISTHAPAGGATSKRARYSNYRRISTHAPAGGATGGASKKTPRLHQFLLTPLREGRRADISCREIQIQISTHAPAGGATRRRCRRLCAGL